MMPLSVAVVCVGDHSATTTTIPLMKKISIQLSSKDEYFRSMGCSSSLCIVLYSSRKCYLKQSVLVVQPATTMYDGDDNDDDFCFLLVSSSFSSRSMMRMVLIYVMMRLHACFVCW